jgi:hypothetical protein
MTEFTTNEVLTSRDVFEENVKAKRTTEAHKSIQLLGRLEGDSKSLAKRLLIINPELQAWPQEVRDFLRFVRETRDTLEQQHPELTT